MSARRIVLCIVVSQTLQSAVSFRTFSVGQGTTSATLPPRLARRPASEAKELAGRAFMPPSLLTGVQETFER